MKTLTRGLFLSLLCLCVLAPFAESQVTVLPGGAQVTSPGANLLTLAKGVLVPASYTVATLPTCGTAATLGAIARVTDDVDPNCTIGVAPGAGGASLCDVLCSDATSTWIQAGIGQHVVSNFAFSGLMPTTPVTGSFQFGDTVATEASTVKAVTCRVVVVGSGNANADTMALCSGVSCATSYASHSLGVGSCADAIGTQYTMTISTAAVPAGTTLYLEFSHAGCTTDPVLECNASLTTP